MRKKMTIDKEWLEVILTHCLIVQNQLRRGEIIDAYTQIGGIISMIKEQTENQEVQDDQ